LPKFVCRPGSAQTRWGAYSAPPDPLAGWGKGGERGEGRAGGRGKGRGRKGKGRKREGKEGEGEGRGFPQMKVLATALPRYLIAVQTATCCILPYC